MRKYLVILLGFECNSAGDICNKFNVACLALNVSTIELKDVIIGDSYFVVKFWTIISVRSC